MVEIKSPTRGILGYLHDLSYGESDSILILQLPRKTEMINKGYIESAMDALKETLPEGRKALVIGCDVNVYELAGADAIILKLKGLI